MVEQWAAGLVLLLAVAYAVFQAQPPPPQSPLLYQWETMHSHRTKFKKHEIFYKDVDGSINSSGTALVLHGFPTSSFDFHLLLSSLRKIFSRVVFIDFLGHGFSDKPRDHFYSLIEQTEIVEQVLREINVSEFHILSHDYGGSIALELLTRREIPTEPLRFLVLGRRGSTASEVWVQQIVKASRLNPSEQDYSINSVGIISPSMFSESSRETWYMYLLRMPIFGRMAVRLANRASYAQELDHVFGERKADEFTLKQLWFFARYKDEYRAWPSLLSYINERESLEERWLETLRLERIPMCLIHGPADPIVLCRELQALHHKHFAHVSIEELSEGIGHYPQLEAPEELLEKYMNFLRSKVGLELPQTQTLVVMPQPIPKPSLESY